MHGSTSSSYRVPITEWSVTKLTFIIALFQVEFKLPDQVASSFIGELYG